MLLRKNWRNRSRNIKEYKEMELEYEELMKGQKKSWNWNRSYRNRNRNTSNKSYNKRRVEI